MQYRVSAYAVKQHVSCTNLYIAQCISEAFWIGQMDNNVIRLIDLGPHSTFNERYTSR